MTLRCDEISFHRAPACPLVPYYAVSAPGSSRLLVSVHGISRNAREHARAFAPLASAYGVSLVCPVFDAIAYRDYQRLGRRGLGERADRALDQVIDHFRGWAGQARGPFDLFGFSGGAQFAHRYALAFPDRVRRLALAAPGWLTPPEAEARFPWGLAASRRLEALTFDLEGFLTIPTLVMVGRRDTLRDASLRQDQRADAQGRHRLARCKRWARAMCRAAADRRLEPNVSLHVLEHSGHDFKETLGDAMDRVLFDFLYSSGVETSPGGTP